MPALVLAVLLAADQVTYDVAARTEGRMGTAPNNPRETAGAGQFDGLIGVNLKHDNVIMSGAYTPRFVETPPPEGSGLAVIHGARLGLEYQMSATGHLLLQELGSYGRNDFSPLVANVSATSTTRIVDPRLPIKALLSIVESDSTLGVDQKLSRRLTARASVGWLLSGGADAIAQRYIPLQRGPHASASMSWAASRYDSMSLAVNASAATFTNGSEMKLATLAAGFSHEFDPNTRFEMGMGTGIGESSGPSAGGAPTPFPSVSASLSHTEKVHRGSFAASVSGSATPQVDRTSGDIYELATGALSLTWTIDRIVRLNGVGSFGRAVSGPAQVGSQLITAEGSASFPIAALTSFAVGARAAWQSIPPTTPGVLTLPGYQWAAFASFIVGAHGTL